MNALQRQYGDRVAFYVVYIQEAHPVDGWQMGSNIRDGILVRSASTVTERSQVAGTCVLHLGLELPALVDLADDRVERAYTGWPDRLYVIDAAGRVAYKSAPGPFGFQPPDLKPVLDRLLVASQETVQRSAVAVAGVNVTRGETARGETRRRRIR